MVVSTIGAVFIALAVGRALRRPAPAPPIGSPPYGAPRIADIGDLRLIDLRGLAAADLAIGRLGIAQAALNVSRPKPTQIWIIDAAAAAAWTAMGETAAVLVASRLRDPRGLDERNLLHVAKGALAPALVAQFAAAGVAIAPPMGDTPLEDAFEPRQPWTPSPNDRRVPPSDVTSTAQGELMRVIERIAIIDVRLRHPKALANGTAVAALRTLKPAELAAHRALVWIVAPWVLEAIDADELVTIIATIPTVPQRLVIVSSAEDPSPATVLTQHLTPVTERIDGRPVIDVVHDAYLFAAKKLPRL